VLDSNLKSHFAPNFPAFFFQGGVAESCTSLNLDQELILDEDGVVDLM
jgi:hypothetical protein